MIFQGLQGDRQDLRLVVIDLGYSKDKRSCGIVATTPDIRREVNFGEVIELTTELLTSGIPSLLVLEAVLSTFHKPDGNPDIRGDFEKGRGWYYGPGVATLVAATRFLNQLRKRVTADQEVLLAEAFLSFKKTKTTHLSDALNIHKSFWMTEPVMLKDSTEPAVDFINGIPSVRVFKDQ